MSGLISWILIGAVAGYVASKLMGEGSRSVIGYILLGMVGAMVGGLFFNLVTKATKILIFGLPSLLIAVIGACLFIVIVRFRRGGRK